MDKCMQLPKGLEKTCQYFKKMKQYQTYYIYTGYLLLLNVLKSWEVAEYLLYTHRKMKTGSILLDVSFICSFLCIFPVQRTGWVSNFICLNQISKKMRKQFITHPSLIIFCAIQCCNCEYCSLNLTLKLLDNSFIGFLSPFQLKTSLPHLRRTRKKEPASISSRSFCFYLFLLYDFAISFSMEEGDDCVRSSSSGTWSVLSARQHSVLLC